MVEEEKDLPHGLSPERAEVNVTRSYDAVVIGTGFGGAVTACRLAQAGFRVGILERGRRYPRGAFPRDFTNPLNGWQWKHGQGLFDVKPLSEMQVVQAAGYGGGSLIYANVHLRPVVDVFEEGWPRGYSRRGLDPYYDLVAYMLDVKPITESPYGLPPKAVLLKQAANELERRDQFFYPTIAVNFGERDVARDNKFGVPQTGCSYCGECDIGCNVHAKNTLDLNYLWLAEKKHGAHVYPLCEASKIERVNGRGYQVHYVDHAHGETNSLEAARVFLCAGAVNSTELLLRCRDEYKSLPDITDALGFHYSGNGDFLAFAFNTQEPAEPWTGPSITAGVLFDRGKGAERTWFLLEDGGYPRQIAGLLRVLNPKLDMLRQLLDAPLWLRDDLRNLLNQKARAWIAAAGAEDPHVLVFLCMGRDKAGGRIRLLPSVDSLAERRLCLEWDVRPNLPLYNLEERLASDVARQLGGDPVLNPAWRLFNVPVTVHNLGGCLMADSEAGGVTDPYGEVFNYPGLYVLDGAILPASTGVNPSATIAAVAERNIEHIIRGWKGDQTWQAPEAAAARAARPVDALATVVVPAGGTLPPRTPAVGLAFAETMRGYLQKGHRPLDDYAGGEKAAQTARATAQFTLTIAIDDLDHFLIERMHTGVATGKIHVAGFTGPEGAPVASGVFNLFVEDPNQPDERRMLYALPFLGADNQPYLLDGFKVVRGQSLFEVWPTTTTLYTVIRQGHTRDGPVLATGIIRLHPWDFLRQLTTFTVTESGDPVRQAQTLLRFGQLFMGTLWEVFSYRGPLSVFRWGWYSLRLFLQNLLRK